MSVNGEEPLEAILGRFWAIADDEESVISVEDEDPPPGLLHISCARRRQKLARWWRREIQRCNDVKRRRGGNVWRRLLSDRVSFSIQLFLIQLLLFMNAERSEEDRRFPCLFCRHQHFCSNPLTLVNGFLCKEGGGGLGWLDRWSAGGCATSPSIAGRVHHLCVLLHRSINGFR
jgi:hypothetical protein